MAPPPPSLGPGSDTPVEILEEQARLLAALTPAARVKRVRDLTVGASLVALAGLRHRHPHATEPELLLRLAALRLGADVVARVYGWRPAEDGA